MERLTMNNGICQMASTEFCLSQKDCYSCPHGRKCFKRLAAYEDTGLEPEEITTEPYGCVFYCNRKCNLDGDFCAEGPGCPREIDAETAKRLLELAQAEKDGRLVVLPCKVGDTVYVTYGEGYKPCVVDRIHIIANNQVQVRLRYFCTETLWLSASEFGKTVFLTREEAEAALKRGRRQKRTFGYPGSGPEQSGTNWEGRCCRRERERRGARDAGG